MVNFRICVDRGGKMPILRNLKDTTLATHPWFVEYRNNRPVGYKGPVEIVATRSPVTGKLNFWDYSTQSPIGAETVNSL